MLLSDFYLTVELRISPVCKTEEYRIPSKVGPFGVIQLQFEDTKWVVKSHKLTNKRTYNKTVKIKRPKEQAMINKTLLRKRKTEQHEFK